MLHTVTIPATAMHAAASLTPFASKDKMTPILNGVAVSVAGGEFCATATDRYVVGDYSITIDDDTAELPAVVIPSAMLTAFTRAAGRIGTVTLTHDDESGALSIDHGAGVIRGDAIRGTIPSVRRLFPEQTYDLPASFGMNPEFFARLAKVKNPDGRTMMPAWRFSGGADSAASSKTPPVFATVDHVGGHTFRALMQPVL